MLEICEFIKISQALSSSNGNIDFDDSFLSGSSIVHSAAPKKLIRRMVGEFGRKTSTKKG